MNQCEPNCTKPISRFWVAALFDDQGDYSSGMIVDSGVTLDSEIVTPMSQGEYLFLQTIEKWVLAILDDRTAQEMAWSRVQILHTEDEDGLRDGLVLDRDRVIELTDLQFVSKVTTSEQVWLN